MIQELLPVLLMGLPVLLMVLLPVLVAALKARGGVAWCCQMRLQSLHLHLSAPLWSPRRTLLPLRLPLVPVVVCRVWASFPALSATGALWCGCSWPVLRCC
jgi:hypothetical protein